MNAVRTQKINIESLVATYKHTRSMVQTVILKLIYVLPFIIYQYGRLPVSLV